MNADMTSLIRQALDAGFTQAGVLDAATLIPRQEVRAMCAADLCRSYGTSWTCPPASPSPEEAQALLAKYKTGILVQTTGTPDDAFDLEGMEEIGRTHAQRFLQFVSDLRTQFPGMLALGNGACTLCPECAYPASCRRPDDIVYSMEAFGLVVSDTCTANGMQYYYGPGTMTFTGCVLVS